MGISIRLIQEDFLKAMSQLAEEKVRVDAVIIDPPYGTTQCRWDSIIPFDLMWKMINEVNKNITILAIFGSEPFSSYLRLSNRKYYKYDWFWLKNHPSNFFHAARMPLRQVENISIFYEKQCTYNPIYIPYSTIGNGKKFITKKSLNNDSIYGQSDTVEYCMDFDRGRHPSNVLFFNAVSRNKRLHPSQKPVKLLKYLIQTYTNPGDLVLDFCMGSGTTGVAAKKLARSFIGIENNVDYFKIAKDRINNTVHEPELFNAQEFESCNLQKELL